MNNSKQPDEHIFQEAVGDIQPLRIDKVAPYHVQRKPVPIEQPDLAQPGDELADGIADTPDFLDFKRPGVQNRLYQDLRRGVLEPQATLDLHGMRVQDARQALSLFIRQSLDARRRCVRVIHGKGKGSDARQPVLKQRVNQWLPQIPEVLAYCAAPSWDGGSGAAYVLLSMKSLLR